MNPSTFGFKTEYKYEKGGNLIIDSKQWNVL